VLLAEHVPGLNDVGTKGDEILLPDKKSRITAKWSRL